MSDVPEIGRHGESGPKSCTCLEEGDFLTYSLHVSIGEVYPIRRSIQLRQMKSGIITWVFAKTGMQPMSRL